MSGNGNNQKSNPPAEGVAVTKSLDTPHNTTTPIVIGVAATPASAKGDSANRADQYRNHDEGGGGNGANPDGPHTVPVDGYQDWSTGICDCTTDPSNCWDTCLCHPCNLAAQYNKLNRNQSSVNWPLCLGVAALDIFLTGGLATFTEVVVVRFQVRSRYHIGVAMNAESDHSSMISFLKEILILAFCTPCATCQNHREMALHGEWPGKILFGKDPALVHTEAPAEVHIV